jgi:hypothetical protein
MPEFAKLYGSGDDQILVMRQHNDEEDQAEIRFFIRPKNDFFGVCSVALGFDDDKIADEAFKKVTEESARKAVKTIQKTADEYFK